jgi:hypothetical protein
METHSVSAQLPEDQLASDPEVFLSSPSETTASSSEATPATGPVVSSDADGAVVRKGMANGASMPAEVNITLERSFGDGPGHTIPLPAVQGSQGMTCPCSGGLI